MCYSLSTEINASAADWSDNWYTGNSAVSKRGRAISQRLTRIIFMVSISAEIFQDLNSGGRT